MRSAKTGASSANSHSMQAENFMGRVLAWGSAVEAVVDDDLHDFRVALVEQVVAALRIGER